MAPPITGTGNALVNTETGEKKWFPQTHLRSAIMSGEWRGQDGDRMYVLNQAGGNEVINAADALTAFGSLGYNSESKDNIRHREKEVRLDEKYGDSPVRTFLESGASGLTFGLSDYVLGGTAASAEGLRQRRARHSGWVTGGGELAGIVGGAILSGGGSLLAKGAAGGAKAVAGKAATRTILPRAAAPSAVNVAARFTPAGASNIAGMAAGRMILPAEVGAAVSGKRMFAARSLQFGTEGALYGLGSGLSKPALSDDPLSAETIFSEMGSGILWGVGAGTGFSVLAETGLWLRRAKQRRLTHLESRIDAEKGPGARSMIAIREGWEKAEVGKIAKKEAARDLRKAEKAESAAERIHVKEVKAAQKDLDTAIKFKDSEIAAVEKELTQLDKNVKAAEVKEAKIEKQFNEMTKKIAKGQKVINKKEIELGLKEAKDITKKAAAKAKDAANKKKLMETARSEFEAKKIKTSEAIEKEVDRLNVKLEEMIRDQDALAVKLEDAEQQAKELVAKLEKKRSKLGHQVQGEQTAARIKRLDIELGQARKAEQEATDLLNTEAAKAGKDFKKVTEEITDTLEIPAEGAPDKFVDRMLVLRKNAEDWKSSGRRTWRAMGFTDEMGEIEMMQATNLWESEKRLLFALDDFDDYFLTQKEIGVKSTRRVGRGFEHLRERRIDRSVVVNEGRILKVRDNQPQAYDDAMSAIKELEAATKDHARMVLQESVGYGDDLIKKFPKDLDTAYARQLSASQYLDGMVAGTHGKVARALSSRTVAGQMWTTERKVTESLATKEGVAAARSAVSKTSAKTEKVAGERAGAKYQQSIEVLQARHSKIKALAADEIDAEKAVVAARGDLDAAKKLARKQPKEARGLVKEAEGELASARQRLEEAEQAAFDLPKVGKEVDDLLAKTPEQFEAEAAAGALDDFNKNAALDILIEREDAVRAMGAMEDDLLILHGQAGEELAAARQLEAAQPGQGAERVAAAEKSLEDVRKRLDDTASNTADIKAAKLHTEEMRSASTKAEAQDIANRSDLKFGTAREGGAGAVAEAEQAAKMEVKKKKRGGFAGEAIKSGAGSGTFHIVRELWGGLAGVVAAGAAASAVRRAGGRGAKAGSAHIDMAFERGHTTGVEKISYAVGAFLGTLGVPANIPMTGATTKAVLDKLTFSAGEFKGDKQARLSPLQQSYYDKVKEIRLLMANPEAYMDNLTEATGNVRAIDPKLATQLSNNEFKRLMYIASKIPQTPPMGYAGSSYDEHIPSDSTIAKFARIAGAAYNPMSVMAKLSRGTLTTDEAKALEITSPEIFTRIQEEFITAMSDKKAKKLSFRKRIQLTVLFGLPADSVMKAIRARQDTFVEKAQQVDLSRVKQTAQDQETQSQRLEK
jgi:hypothetical protein